MWGSCRTLARAVDSMCQEKLAAVCGRSKQTDRDSLGDRHDSEDTENDKC